MNPEQFQGEAYLLLSRYGYHDWKIRWWPTPNIVHDGYEFAVTSHEEKILTFSLNLIEVLNEETALKILKHEMAHVVTGKIFPPHGLVWKNKHRELFGESPLPNLSKELSKEAMNEIVKVGALHHPPFCPENCTPFLGKPLEEIKGK